ncbi:MAG TPA: alpha,alpha-trehalose-phosphate synthase (UDP-forming) [Alphaproteobacteria bacterium]|nr:alpha,alpha-trehalose-phosphate synthase (UDP-forming) [Alphaproteobacteria bacterium]
MSRLVVVSNRVSLPKEKGARAGGLAVAMREALQKQGGLWFGWSGETGESNAEPKVMSQGNIDYAVIDLSKDEYEDFYLGFANSTLWPLFHYRLGLVEFSRKTWQGYSRVNNAFALALQPLLRPDDIVWVHDYHLIPLATELRRMGVRNRIGFFLHTPFPTGEVLVALPVADAIARGLMDYDLIGFQTENDRRALADYIVNEAGGEALPDGTLAAYGRTARAAAFPISIDTADMIRTARQAAKSADARRLVESLAGRALIIGVDRLDYSKGLPNRFEAFRTLLTDYEDQRGRATFMQIAPPSRTEVARYRALRRELEALAGHVNGRFAEFDWVPIRYINKSFNRQQLAGFYRHARIGLVTPLRDGMNLVAKEYVAAQDGDDPGVLVLSRFAGAARELDAALIVNPYDNDQVAQALHRGLTMSLPERRERWERCLAVLKRNTISTWREAFLGALQETG